MKSYSIELLTMATALTLAMAAYSQETNKTEEYLNPGEPIQVKAGQKFIIRMESNPTTGYGWKLSKALDEKVVQFVTNAYIPPDSKLCGAGGHELWTFKAIEPGQVDISLKYVRPWEKYQPARTNVFTVIVK
jgi:inhibitor of cysteine peptidase